MNRNYDKVMDGNGALRSGHATIKHLLHCATHAIQYEQFADLADIYNRIEMLASSLRESAEIREQAKTEEQHEAAFYAVRQEA